MPVDTNIFSVVNPMAFAIGRDSAQTRKALERLIPPEKFYGVHFSVIRLGNDFYKSRGTLYLIRPANPLCDYRHKFLKQM